MRFFAQPGHQTRSAPKLNVVPTDKALGALDCFGVVQAG